MASRNDLAVYELARHGGDAQNTAALAALTARVVILEAEVAALMAAPGAGSMLTLTAKGAISAGDPVYTPPGFPGAVSRLSTGEAAITAYKGFAALAAMDGAPVSVIYQGPATLFMGLLINPTAPDMPEYFVYEGNLLPVLFSSIPSNSWYRLVGTPLNSTTLVLNPGASVIKKP